MNQLESRLFALQSDLQEIVLKFVEQSFAEKDQIDLPSVPGLLIQELGGLLGDTIWRVIDNTNVQDTEEKIELTSTMLQLAFNRAFDVVAALDGAGELEVVMMPEASNTTQ